MALDAWRPLERDRRPRVKAAASLRHPRSRSHAPLRRLSGALACVQQDPKALAAYLRLVWRGNLKDFKKVSQEDPVTQTDGELAMLRRAIVLIRALSAALAGSPVDMALEWESLARRVLADAGVTRTALEPSPPASPNARPPSAPQELQSHTP